MEEFIEAIRSTFNELDKEILDKIKHKKKLEKHEILYIREMKDFIERKKKEKCINSKK